jgi:hypothetical protein
MIETSTIEMLTVENGFSASLFRIGVIGHHRIQY